jgi:hypothetical protein
VLDNYTGKEETIFLEKEWKMELKKLLKDGNEKNPFPLLLYYTKIENFLLFQSWVIA